MILFTKFPSLGFDFNEYFYIIYKMKINLKIKIQDIKFYPYLDCDDDARCWSRSTSLAHHTPSFYTHYCYEGYIRII